MSALAHAGCLDGRPVLTLVAPPGPIAPPRIRRCRRPLGWLCDLPGRAAAAVLNRVAPMRLREQAYRDGFALAMGNRARHQLTACLDEYCTGNDDGLASRYTNPVPPQRVCLVRFAQEGAS